MAKDKGGRPSKGRLPKTVKVHGVRWKVVPRRQAVLDGEEVEGACHYDTRRIEVTVGSGSEIVTLENFWHELLHIAFHESGVQSISDDAEHAIIKVLEKFLAENVDFRARPRKHRHSGRSEA